MKVNVFRIARVAMLPALMTGSVACSPTFGSDPKFEVRPVTSATDTTLPPSEGEYQSAVDAIVKRDYALALDHRLEAAKAIEPGSARVLNAFGVVYDKLGRFDLSARYYAQAQVADPKSQIVAKNTAYSKVLQGLMNPSQLAESLLPQSAPEVAPAEVKIAGLGLNELTNQSLAPSLTPTSQAPRSAPEIAPAEVKTVGLGPNELAESGSGFVADTNIASATERARNSACRGENGRSWAQRIGEPGSELCRRRQRKSQAPQSAPEIAAADMKTVGLGPNELTNRAPALSQTPTLHKPPQSAPEIAAAAKYENRRSWSRANWRIWLRLCRRRQHCKRHRARQK